MKFVIKECQLPMLLVWTHIQSDTQKHVIGLFSIVKGDETSHIIDGINSKYITMPFTSDALYWCCDDGYKCTHTHEGFLLMPNKEAKRKIWQKGLCKRTQHHISA